MKKYILVLSLAAVLLMQGASPALAKDDPFTKFGRGMANIVASPMELYAQPLLLAKNSEPAIAVFGGLFKGISMMIAREIVGAYEIATFPLPIPWGYRPIITPATVFTDWDTRVSHDQ